MASETETTEADAAEKTLVVAVVRPSPFFIATLIFLAIALFLWLALWNALTRPIEVRKEPLSFTEVVRPYRDCGDAVDYYNCLTYRVLQ